MISRILIAASALALSGCAELGVRVDVLQPEYLGAATVDATLRLEAHKLAMGDYTAVDLFIARQKTSFLAYRSSCLGDLVLQAGSIADPKKRQQYIAQVNQAIASPELLAQVDADFSARRATLYQGERADADAIRRSFSADVGVNSLTVPMSGGLRALLLDRRLRFDQQTDEIYRIAAGQATFCSEQAQSYLATLQAAAGPRAAATATTAAAARDATVPSAVAAIDQSIFGGATDLAQVRGAFDIVHAPKAAWGLRYNKSYGLGIGGNTDVALKLDRTADFTVKGFAFDGRSTAQMVSKVTAQTLSVIAQAYGVNVPLASSQGSAAATTTLGTGAAQDQAAIDTANAKAAAFRANLLHIADLIVADPNGLKSGASPMKDAVATAIASGSALWPAPTAPPK